MAALLGKLVISSCLFVLVGLWEFGSAQVALPPCERTKCIPNCACDEEMNDAQCAFDFGNFGWVPPPDPKRMVLVNLGPRWNITRDKIKPAGMRGANRETGIGTGIAEIESITNTTMKGIVYFEMHPDAFGKTTLMAELYGGIDFGSSDCDEGIILGKQLVNMSGVDDRVLNFDYGIRADFDYNDLYENMVCHPRAKNGKMVGLTFSLEDPWYYNEQSDSIMNIWYPLKIGAEVGNLEFCVRVNLVDGDQTTILSFLDTKFKVEILAPSNETNWIRFDPTGVLTEVKVYSNQPIGVEEDDIELFEISEVNNNGMSINILPRLEVEAYLCSHPYESTEEGKYPSRTFKNGQTFRICVSPGRGMEDIYSVLGFNFVVCENKGRETSFIEDGKANDYLTLITEDTIGFAKARGGKVETPGTISMDAVVTSSLAGLFSKSLDFFECEGEVFLKYNEVPEEEIEEPTDETDEEEGTDEAQDKDEEEEKEDDEEGNEEPDEESGEKNVKKKDKEEQKPDAKGGFTIRVNLVFHGGGVLGDIKEKRDRFFSWFSSGSPCSNSGKSTITYASTLGSALLLSFL